MAKHAVAWGLGIAMAAAVAGVGAPASAQEPQAAEPAAPAAEGAVELPKLTAEQLEEMAAMNPRAPAEIRQEIEAERFLRGEDVEPAAPSHEAGAH